MARCSEEVRVADWLASGVVPLTGRADGPPLVPPGHAATTARELAGRIAEATGGRVRVDGPALLGERAAFTGHTRNGRSSPGGAARLLPTADGWAAASCARPDDPLLYGALIEREIDGDPWSAVAGWLAEHTGEELAERAELLGLPAAPIRPTPPAALHTELSTALPTWPPRDVRGLRVVDFSALWAGPLCAQLLGLAGAEIVKVETADRPDGARRGHPGFYRLLHGGHRAVAVDPSTADGRSALAALVRSADIVIEASRPRALRGFGIDAEAEVARGATWISITAAGRASNRVGFGDDVAAAAGLVATDDDGGPLFVGDAIADPLTGLTAAACALTSPSTGVLWDVPMAGVIAATLDGTPSRPAPAGAAPPRHRPLGPPAPDHGADPLVALGIGHPC